MIESGEINVAGSSEVSPWDEPSGMDDGTVHPGYNDSSSNDIRVFAIL